MSKACKGTKADMMRKAMEHCLGEMHESIYAFFKQIMDGNYDLIVVVSRRCYVLFQMFALIEGWSFENICTDLGLYANREKLKSCSSVIVVDDIGYSGRSIRKVLRQVRRYISHNCKVMGVLYAVSRSSADKILCSKKLPIGEEIKCRFQLTSRKCHEVSVRLVSAILKAGMPYTVFVYPFWGKRKKSIESDYALIPSPNKMNLFEDYKWKTLYLNLEGIEKVSGIQRISEYSCVRVYKEPQGEKIEYFLPFMFLKSVKADKVDNWCRHVAKMFVELDREELAKEIEAALNEKEETRKDAIEYVACILSCFCSKAIAEILNLSEYLEAQKEGIRSSLGGSFSDVACDALEACDEIFSISFLDKLSDAIGNADIFYQENEKKCGIGAEGIKNFVLEKCMELNAYETTYAIFEWLKSNESDQCFEKANSKVVYLDDIVYVLKEIRNFKLEDIYLAQIECWDIGVATYRIYYDPQKGIVGVCSSGEMSAVIPTLKYQEIIKEYFREMLEVDYAEENDDKQREILKAVLKKANIEKKYTEKEIAEFKEIVKERNGSLYGMLI